MANLTHVSIVIPNYNGSALLEKCLRSLQSQTCRRMEIIVVDNASSDKSLELARAVAPDSILLKQNRNLGFSGAVNAGIQSSHGDWIAVLNNDTELASNWLEECVRAIENHPDAAFFACRILDFSDRNIIYSAGDCFLRTGIGYRRGQELPDRAEFQRECPIFSASGCAAIFRRKVLEEMGGFDNRFFAYLEDVDLGLRLQAAGYRGYYLPRAEVYHHGAATSGGEFSSLAVRLRTRNSLLLLFKSVPGTFLFRCLPMIVLAQLSWMVRALIHGRFWSYARGLGSAFLLAPAMINDRAGLRKSWRNSGKRLWQDILASESQARTDFESGVSKSNSFFLSWYFRIFGKGQNAGYRIQDTR